MSSPGSIPASNISAAAFNYAAFLRWAIDNAREIPNLHAKAAAWWSARGVVARWAAIKDFGDALAPVLATFPHPIVETLSVEQEAELENAAVAAIQQHQLGDGVVVSQVAWGPALRKIFELAIKYLPLLLELINSGEE